PQRSEGQCVYAARREYVGAMVPRMLDAGAAIVGGCCGTTPAHIAAMRVALDATSTVTSTASTAASAPAVTVRATFATPTPPPAPDGRLEPPPPTPLLARLRDGRFVISVEIDPPRSIRIDRTIEAAALLRDAGVDLGNVSDSAMARVRMGAMAVAFGIQHDLDLECLVHFTTRDRNLMAIESELLGAHALGVRNIL